MKKKKTTIIDFSGKAGAGKTYVKNEILKRLSVDHKCLDLSDYVLSVREHFNFFLTAPSATTASLAFILFSVPRSYRAMCRMLRTWFSIQIKIKKALTLNCGFFFIDEGLLRKLSLMRAHTLRKFTFEGLPAFIKKSFFYPDLTVFVTADFDLCEKRRMARDAGTKKFKPRGPQKRGLTAVEELQRDILAAEKSGFAKVIPYDNNGEFDVSIIEQIYNLRKIQKDEE